MHWYGGSMAEAVTLSRQRNAIFVVFVEDDNNLSKELASTIDDSVVIKRLMDQNNFLAVKLKSGSENYTYFAQIYQFVPVPSLFFIGRNGTPLEVVCAGVEASNLATRIDRILMEHRKEQAPNSVQPSTSSRNIRDETVNFLQTEATVATSQAEAKVLPAKPAEEENSTEPIDSITEAKTAQEAPKQTPEAPKHTPEAPKSAPAVEEPLESGPAAKIQKTEGGPRDPPADVVCVGDVCVRTPRGGAGSSSSQQEPTAPQAGAVDQEEKMMKAKEVIEARRREKAAQEKELEKQKELERRSVGQGVAELKRWQAEQEMKQIQEERKREKQENDMARQRILEQIAQDRAERRAREARDAPATPPHTATVTTTHATAGDACVSRVQFKLPDGATHVASFPARATLDHVRAYVTGTLQPEGPFSLWTAFPRRELRAGGRTLFDLQLAPSAALLVLPPSPAATPPATPGVLALLTTLFTTMILNPTYLVYYWIRDRFFAARPAPPADRTSPDRTGPGPDRTGPRPGLRRRGNVHRLTGDGNSDDDNNTWNGNSTQQM